MNNNELFVEAFCKIVRNASNKEEYKFSNALSNVPVNTLITNDERAHVDFSIHLLKLYYERQDKMKQRKELEKAMFSK